MLRNVLETAGVSGEVVPSAQTCNPGVTGRGRCGRPAPGLGRGPAAHGLHRPRAAVPRGRAGGPGRALPRTSLHHGQQGSPVPIQGVEERGLGPHRRERHDGGHSRRSQASRTREPSRALAAHAPRPAAPPSSPLSGVRRRVGLEAAGTLLRGMALRCSSS